VVTLRQAAQQAIKALEQAIEFAQALLSANARKPSPPCAKPLRQSSRMSRLAISKLNRLAGLIAPKPTKARLRYMNDRINQRSSR